MPVPGGLGVVHIRSRVACQAAGSWGRDDPGSGRGTEKLFESSYTDTFKTYSDRYYK